MVNYFPSVKRSICGCSLQTGNKITGYVSTLIGIGLLVSGVSLSLDEHKDDPEKKKLSIIIGASSAGYGLIFFISSFLLLCGASQAKRSCMLPFLIFEYINVILIALMIPWLLYEGLYVAAVILVIPFCLIAYLILIIQSFYRNLSVLYTI